VSEHDHWSKVSQLHFVHVQVGIVYENKGSWGKIKVMDGIHVLLLELVDRGVAAGKDVVMYGGEVSWSFLQLVGTNG